MLIASKSITKIQSLKKKLSDAFEMKDLLDAKRILGMDIFKNKREGKLFLSQEAYLKKVLKRFLMHESKFVSTPLGQQLKLSKDQCPNTEAERDQMNKISYASGVGNLMYAIVCSRPDLAYSITVVSRYMTNTGNTH